MAGKAEEEAEERESLKIKAGRGSLFEGTTLEHETFPA